MELIRPSIEFIDKIDRNNILQKIERAGRTCYKSESNITPESASKFVANLVKRGHWAMIEHGASITVKITTDRGVTHEIVRHRLASYAQESTRYCNYSNSKFGDDIKFVIPAGKLDKLPEGKLDPIFYKDTIVGFTLRETPNVQLPLAEDELIFLTSLYNAEQAYKDYLACGHTPQEARALLPNALKTEIIVTMNLREWKHFLDLRSKGTTGAPHPDMKAIADIIYKCFVVNLPEIFE